jgi:GTP-binding protein
VAFVDSARTRVRGGQGGRGAVSFRAEPFVPRGGPDGGDGGRGGSVVLRARDGLDDLAPIARRRLWKAADGAAGAGGRKEGKAGSDLVVEVPVGTLVHDDATGDLLADLAEPGASLVAAAGGAGGEGNVHRATSVNRAPTTAGPGEPGEERELRLELRVPVDVALLGPANAGKSALLAALTNARPRVAPYPHTTTRPEPGVIFDEHGAPVVLLEIPAAGGVAQLERARAVALVHDGRFAPDPALRAAAGDRPVIDVRTHADEVPASARLSTACWVSTATGEGIEELRQRLLDVARTAPPRPRAEPAPAVHRLRQRRAEPEPVVVRRRDWGFELAGPALERLLERYNLATPEGFDRFQVALDRAGVSAALADAGAEPGDTVRIGDSEFEYQP